VNSPSFALFYAARPMDTGGPRIGFTTPRAVGKSVDRNRMKRRMREAIRLEIPSLTAAVDYVFHPRRPVLDIAFPQLQREVERMFRKCEAAARR
jgi:ribonuclease P protein component